MISWDRVNELREEIGDDDFAEVAEMFLEEVAEVIQRLKTNPVPAQYEEDLHFLKGSALNLGFRALSTLCQAGERKAASGDYASIVLEPVFEVYAQSCAEFASR